MSDDKLLLVLTDIRNWIRAAAHGPVKTLLESVLPDAKSRLAYQMLDGTVSMDQVRIACKMSPNGLFALAQECTARGLMEVNADKKRVRLFNLEDFGLIEPVTKSAPKNKK
jgi:sulfur transfer complex TusBCD TusB component (DsrH family)